MEGRGRENGFTIYSREGKDKYNMCKNDCTESLCQTKEVLLFCFFFLLPNVFDEKWKTVGEGT